MAEGKKDYRSAFPIAGVSDGMSLRDYFAAKALVALLSIPQHHGAGMESGRGTDIPAEAAYRIADAMLEARNRG